MDDVTAQSNANVTITLNGKMRCTPIGASVSDLLEDLDLQERLVVVERNGTILARSEYGGISLENGDVLEIVHFVGGGCIDRRIPEVPL